jgi:Mn2+/Fe2+ NRAMP family transporter
MKHCEPITTFRRASRREVVFAPILTIKASSPVLVLSQVVLALQLPFAMFPLLHFASSRKVMGRWRLGWFLMIAGWGSALLITAFDFYGLPDAFKEAWNTIFGK